MLRFVTALLVVALIAVVYSPDGLTSRAPDGGKTLVVVLLLAGLAYVYSTRWKRSIWG